MSNNFMLSKELTNQLPILMVVRFTAWVCGHSLSGILGSNLAWDIDVLCVVK